jgi:hypothetical protein
MATALHILTKPDDAFARDIIAREPTLAGPTVDVVDLTGDSPDYADLLQRIFAADSVAVW